MLYWSLVFLVLALVAGAFGLSGIAGTSAWMAQVLFVGFLVVAALSFFARHAPKSA